MFVSIMQFPPIKQGHEDEFQQWFAWSAEQFKGHDGLISRRLLKAENNGGYIAIVELKDQKTFTDMHNSPTQAIVHDRLVPLLDGLPTRESYNLVES